MTAHACSRQACTVSPMSPEPGWAQSFGSHRGPMVGCWLVLWRRSSDTEGFYTAVQKTVLSKYGKEFSWGLKVKMMGKTSLEAAKVLVEESGLQGQLDPQEFLKQREALLQDMFPTTNLMPGAERLVRHLHKHGVPIAVATSSHTAHYYLKTTKHKELFSLFDHVVRGDDPKVALGKPNPDIFLEAASRFQAPPRPENVLVFEDAPVGVEAGVRAGMPVVMVPDARTDPELCKLATQVIPSLEQFDPAAWGLPPF